MLRGSTVAGTERMRFREHLDFKSVASREAAFLARRLQEDDTGYRGEVLRFLVSRTGRKALSSPDDGAFCAALLASSPSPGLSALLRGIAAYEAFARLVTDAFEAVLDELAKRNTKIDPTSLARLPDVAKAGREASRRHQAASEALEPLGLLPRFQENFAALAEPGAAADWLERLVEHHRRTQRQKSPVRKAPWFDRFDDGDLMILYRRDSKDRPPGDYVHRYRVGPLDSFARDLGLF